MPNKENIKLWVDALRSKKYTQTSAMLCNGESHCCLGVACEVYQEHVGNLNITMTKKSKKYDSNNNYLPLKVCKWLGIEKTPISNVINYNGTAISYIFLNDSHSYSFDMIADELENQFLGL